MCWAKVWVRPSAASSSKAPIDPVDRIICDMNGERYRGNEYGFAVLRNPAASWTPPISRRRRIAGAMSAPPPAPLFVSLVTEAEARGIPMGR